MNDLSVLNLTYCDQGLSYSYSGRQKCATYSADTESLCLSAVGDLDCIDEWKDGAEQQRLEFIRKDCQARLKDVRVTNKKAKSLSAFVSILSFIGYLSKLAFSKDPSLGAYKQNGCGMDQIIFQSFCDRYLLGDRNFQSKINKPGLSYLLYKFVRCGLIHGATLVNIQPPAHERTGGGWCRGGYGAAEAGYMVSTPVNQIVGICAEVFVGRVVPVGVCLAEKLAAMADRKYMNLIIAGFVHDAIRKTEGLKKVVAVLGLCSKTLTRNGLAEIREQTEEFDVIENLDSPFGGVFMRKFVGNRRENLVEKRLRMRREKDVHLLTLRFLRELRNSSDSLLMRSSGMPFPSANSRREMSMSRESARRSSRLGRRGARIEKGMRRSRAIVTMQTFRTDEAVRPTSLQKPEKSFLRSSSTEIVMFAIVFIPLLSFKTSVVYHNRTRNAMWRDGFVIKAAV